MSPLRRVCPPWKPILVVSLGLAACPAAAQSPVQLTSSGGSRPTLSPDGAWVAYLANSGIYRVSTSGGSPELVSTISLVPDWSPTDADLIAVLDGGTLAVVSVSTGQLTPIVSSNLLDEAPPRWSPLGDELAVTTRSPTDGIVFVSYPGGEVTGPLACTDPVDGGCAGEGPSWSPDGEHLAFEDGLQIMRVPRAGGAASVITDPGFDVAEPAWSPDGTWIAFSADSTDFESSHLWIARADGTGSLMQLTSGPYRDRAPDWSPDSQTIYFQSDRTGSTEIWKISFPPVGVVPTTWSRIKLRY